MKGVDRIKKFFGPTNVDKQLWFWKYNCFLFLDLAPNGFFALVGPSSRYFEGQGKVQKLYCDRLMQTINVGFASTALFYYFNLTPFGVFFALFRPFGAIFGFGWGTKRFLKLINVDYQFWFWNYRPILLFSFGPIWGRFGPFWALWGYF